MSSHQGGNPAAGPPPPAQPGSPYGPPQGSSGQPGAPYGQAPQPYPHPGQTGTAPLPPVPVWAPPVPTYPYAAWPRRVGAYLIDFAPAYVAMIPFWIGYVLLLLQVTELTSTSASSAEVLRPALLWMGAGWLLMLAALGWQWYNRWLVAGRTGQSWGKRVLRTRVLAEATGQPVGPVNAFLRDLLHVLDGAAYVGFLWPLWDAKRQTFADMIMKTVVTDFRAAPPAPTPGVSSPPAGGGWT